MFRLRGAAAGILPNLKRAFPWRRVDVREHKMSKPSKIAKFMESVRPTRIWIDGKAHIVDKCASEETEEYTERFTKEYNIDIVEDQYHTSFKLASVYYRKIKTFEKITIEDLEQDTGAKIMVPTEGVDEKIVIRGSKLEDVIEARRKIQSLVSAIRDKQAAMQFVAIPVQSDEIRDKFAEFKEALLSEEADIKGMHESIFQKVERLHLTIAVFTLMDDFEKIGAIKALQECKETIVDPFVAKTGPLKIHVKGLDCMNSNYSKANIMYGNAKFASEDDEYNLQNIVDSVFDYFYYKGLVKQPQQNVKLHVTLINTKYRKNDKRRGKTPFDATPIMEKYNDFDFGMCNFDSIHLSHIAVIDANGFYSPICKVFV